MPTSRTPRTGKEAPSSLTLCPTDIAHTRSRIQRVANGIISHISDAAAAAQQTSLGGERDVSVQRASSVPLIASVQPRLRRASLDSDAGELCRIAEVRSESALHGPMANCKCAGSRDITALPRYRRYYTEVPILHYSVQKSKAVFRAHGPIGWH